MEESYQQVPFSGNPFEDTKFAENPEPRCPCVLLLDTSSSMRGQPITELNAGLNVFKDELQGDSLASKRTEVAIVTFGPVKVEVDFQTANSFYPPTLEAQGSTPMGEAILKAIDMVQREKEKYNSYGISYFRPWILKWS